MKKVFKRSLRKARRASAKLVLVAFDRATLAWHAGQLIRAGEDHAGIILFRGTVRGADYGYQSRLLTSFWETSGHSWDWQNRLVYLPKSASLVGGAAGMK